MSTIQPKIHSFAQALACKRNNETLSTTTLKKLTRIANREFGGNAERVFGKSAQAVPCYNGDAIGLGKAISSQLTCVRSASLQHVMTQWLERLPVTIPQARVSQALQSAPQPGFGSLPPPVVADKESFVAAWVSACAARDGLRAEHQLLPGKIPLGDCVESEDPSEGTPTADYLSYDGSEQGSKGSQSANYRVQTSLPDVGGGTPEECPKPDYWKSVTFGLQEFNELDDTQSVIATRKGPKKLPPMQHLAQLLEEGLEAGFLQSEELGFWSSAFQVPRIHDAAMAAVKQAALKQVGRAEQTWQPSSPVPPLQVLVKLLEKQ